MSLLSLKEIGKIPLLTAEQEIEYASRMMEGDEEARKKFTQQLQEKDDKLMKTESEMAKLIQENLKLMKENRKITINKKRITIFWI